ncbi:hypothetical protein L6452_39127 [Arctium lappa]|uniref:Uncharacterized protein n=1 Tax=Arctium lappa TaxID=4217 RepID=A0ACB8XRM9_ARCLA|nr:hypothetical protein L6452_39127 [Arctium lappa]
MKKTERNLKAFVFDKGFGIEMLIGEEIFLSFRTVADETERTSTLAMTSVAWMVERRDTVLHGFQVSRSSLWASFGVSFRRA